MTKEYNEIELPRFAREITFVQGRDAHERSDNTDAPTGLLAPFAGVLNHFPAHGYWPSSNLSYLVLQPLFVREPAETVRESHHSIQPTSKGRLTDVTPERTVTVSPPSIFRPTTGVIERRIVEKQIPGESVDEPQTNRSPPTTGGGLAKPFNGAYRVRPSPATPLPELRVDQRIHTADNEGVGPGVLHRTANEQRVFRGQDRQMESEDGILTRRTFRRHSDNASFHSVSRLVTPGQRVDRRTIIDLDRRIDQKVPSERLHREDLVRQHEFVSEFGDVTRTVRVEDASTRWRTPSLPDVAGEVIGPRENRTIERQVVNSERRETSGLPDQEAEPETRVRERLREPSGRDDLRMTLTTRSLSRPSSETATERRSRIPPSISHTTSVLERGENGEQDVAGTERGRPGAVRNPGRTIAGETTVNASVTPDPGQVTADPRPLTEMTVRKERANSEPRNRPGPETTHADGQSTLSSRQQRYFDESDSQKRETISSMPSSNKQQMEPEVDIDGLVDRLYAKFERKLRIERERRGR